MRVAMVVDTAGTALATRTANHCAVTTTNVTSGSVPLELQLEEDLRTFCQVHPLGRALLARAFALGAIAAWCSQRRPERSGNCLWKVPKSECAFAGDGLYGLDVT